MLNVLESQLFIDAQHVKFHYVLSIVMNGIILLFTTSLFESENFY